MTGSSLGPDLITDPGPVLPGQVNHENHIALFDLPKLQKFDVQYSAISILKDAPIKAARFIVQGAGELK
jgi:hypothetical protein